MALSKSTRIIILLVIDSLFFLLELITGYAVHSLALVADSFHMLNDVLSLVVGLWAVKAANRELTSTTTKKYTYGYQRAETLGALVNGVFLVALCVTIFLDAIQRFVEPQEVSQPILVLIVGCLGLASNLVGLVLFHDHSHSHGGHSHGPSSESAAEEGHAGHSHGFEPYSDTEPATVGTTGEQPSQAAHSHAEAVPGIEREGTAHSDSTATAVEEFTKKTSNTLSASKRRHSRSTSRGLISADDFQGPSQFRNSIIAQANLATVDSEENTDTEDAAAGEDQLNQNELSKPLLGGTGQKIGYGTSKRVSIDHKGHKHAQPREPGKGGGHSHGDLNMKGIFLHVMGDALGNIGVIATALIIWLAKFPGRFYFDPAISLVITCIILASAIPLCKAASRILLQAVPHGIEVDDIRDDIEDLPGIDSCHHLHVWQLSDTKLVASLHVRVTFNFKGEGSQRYMELASAVRRCLHAYGIHSSTIQPEFHPGSELDDGHDHHGASHSGGSPRQGSVGKGDNSCLLECGDDCGGGKSCCPPADKKGTDSHSHDGHEGHDHSH